MALPRISIVTPCYNSESYLEETIVSVLDQNYPNLQYIIIDGGSQDRSPEIIQKYERHLDYWISEPDQGQSDAICKGLQRCDGDVFNWLNADDTYTLNALSTIGDIFLDPGIQVLAAKSRIYGMGTDCVSSGTNICADSLERTIGRARIDQPETFFRLRRIKRLGGPNRNFHYLMDRELWIRYLITFGLEGVKKINNVVVNFRLHEWSKSVSQKQCFLLEEEKLFQALHSHLSNQAKSCLPKKSHEQVYVEWFLHHYQIAYAIRDWESMTANRQQLSGYSLNPRQLFSVMNLESRKAALRVAKLFWDYLR